MTQPLYENFAHWYDLVYAHKGYMKESEFIKRIVKKYAVKGKDILDVACGTGSHAKILARTYTVTGVDLNKAMLQVAKKKVLQATFKQGNMRSFSLNKKFDVILCLFTALNYNLTKTDLSQAIRNFKRHLNPGGILILDCPSFTEKGKPKATAIPTEKGKVIVLYNFINLGNQRLKIDIFWQIPRMNGYDVIKETHQLQGYSLKKYQDLVKQAGLTCDTYWDYSLKKNKGKRPLLVCRK